MGLCGSLTLTDGIMASVLSLGVRIVGIVAPCFVLTRWFSGLTSYSPLLTLAAHTLGVSLPLAFQRAVRVRAQLLCKRHATSFTRSVALKPGLPVADKKCEWTLRSSSQLAIEIPM